MDRNRSGMDRNLAGRKTNRGQRRGESPRFVAHRLDPQLLKHFALNFAGVCAKTGAWFADFGTCNVPPPYPIRTTVNKLRSLSWIKCAASIRPRYAPHAWRAKVLQTRKNSTPLDWAKAGEKAGETVQACRPARCLPHRKVKPGQRTSGH
jgi:hypothetical protein